MSHMIGKELIDLVIAGDEPAVREFIAFIIPIVERQVTILVNRSRREPARLLVQDLTQDVLLQIFANRADVLRKWQPDRGRSLEAYLAVFARYWTLDMLRKRSTVQLVNDVELNDVEINNYVDPARSLEEKIITRDWSKNFLNELPNRLNESDLDLFRRRFIEQQSSQEICEALGLHEAAFFKRVHRIRLRLLDLFEEISSK